MFPVLYEIDPHPDKPEIHRQDYELVAVSFRTCAIQLSRWGAEYSVFSHQILRISIYVLSGLISRI